MKSVWDLRIARASELVEKNPAAAELLTFYEQLARFQKSIYEKMSRTEDHDVPVLVPFFAELVNLVQKAGSAQLKQTAAALEQAGDEDRFALLNAVWQHSSEADQLAPEYLFFAKALLQPYAEVLASKTARIEETTSSSVCPFCGSRPQVAVLRPEGDGGKRSLVCSL